MKRQTTSEWNPQQKNAKIKKCKSLPNTAFHLPGIDKLESVSCDEDKSKRKQKRKKKKTKVTKKAKP